MNIHYHFFAVNFNFGVMVSACSSIFLCTDLGRIRVGMLIETPSILILKKIMIYD